MASLSYAEVPAEEVPAIKIQWQAPASEKEVKRFDRMSFEDELDEGIKKLTKIPAKIPALTKSPPRVPIGPEPRMIPIRAKPTPRDPIHPDPTNPAIGRQYMDDSDDSDSDWDDCDNDTASESEVAHAKVVAEVAASASEVEVDLQSGPNGFRITFSFDPSPNSILFCRLHLVGMVTRDGELAPNVFTHLRLPDKVGEGRYEIKNLYLTTICAGTVCVQVWEGSHDDTLTEAAAASNAAEWRTVGDVVGFMSCVPCEYLFPEKDNDDDDAFVHDFHTARIGAALRLAQEARPFRTLFMNTGAATTDLFVTAGHFYSSDNIGTARDGWANGEGYFRKLVESMADIIRASDMSLLEIRLSGVFRVACLVYGTAQRVLGEELGGTRVTYCKLGWWHAGHSL